MMEKLGTPMAAFGAWLLAQSLPTSAAGSGVPFVDDLARLGATGVALAVLSILVIRREQQLTLMNDQDLADIQKLTDKMTASMDKHTEAVNGLKVEVHELTKYEEVLKAIKAG